MRLKEEPNKACLPGLCEWMSGETFPFCCRNNTILRLSMQGAPNRSRSSLSSELRNGLLIIRANDSPLIIFRGDFFKKRKHSKIVTAKLSYLENFCNYNSGVFHLFSFGSLFNYFGSVSFRAVIFNLGCTLKSPGELSQSPSAQVYPRTVSLESLAAGLRNQYVVKLPRCFLCSQI